MPIYEFVCKTCGKISSFFTRSIKETVNPICQCGSHDLERAISTFAYRKSGKSAADAGPPPRFPGLDYYRDPRNVGRHVEDTFQKFGLDMPEQVRENIDAAREGETPKDLDI